MLDAISGRPAKSAGPERKAAAVTGRRRRAACAGCDAGELDSEGDNERSFFEQKPPPGLEAGAQVSMRMDQQEPRNSEGVLRIRSSSGAPHVFANKRDRRADVASAVVVGAHAWGGRGVLMRAPRGRGVGTPDLAQQAGVLSKCQRQHDRKESCSKHVMLATHKGKSCASRKRWGPQEILTFSRSRRHRPGGPAEFRRSLPKIPRVRLAGFNEALRGLFASGGTDAAVERGVALRTLRFGFRRRTKPRSGRPLNTHWPHQCPQ